MTIFSNYVSWYFQCTVLAERVRYLAFSDSLTPAMNGYFVCSITTNLGQLSKPGIVLESANPEDFKTVPES